MSSGKDVETLFLLDPPSFATGAAEAFDLFGTTLEWNEALSETQADLLATRHDWRMIGDDLRRAVAEYRDKAA